MQLAPIDEYLFSDPDPILNIGCMIVKYRSEDENHPLMKFAGQFSNYHALVGLRKNFEKMWRHEFKEISSKRFLNVSRIVSSFLSSLQLAHALNFTKELVKDNIASKVEKVVLSLKAYHRAQKRIYSSSGERTFSIKNPSKQDLKLAIAVFDLFKALFEPLISSRKVKLALDGTSIGMDYCLYPTKQNKKKKLASIGAAKEASAL
ncbi:MAG: hypothetical protein FJZ60_00680 [Chlamydiae bacterium]|nr:hypothetical protein [Chlamydiota bacterium]